MRRKLLDKISELNAENSFDYLFISGDITNQGQKYSDVHIRMIKMILETINLNVDQLFIVPGYHDLTRNPSRTELIENILGNTSQSPSDLLDTIIKEDEESLDVLLSSFQQFNEFYIEIKGEAYPLNKVHKLVRHDNFYLILLNTCLLSNKSGEEGCLLIAKDSLFDCLDSISLEDNIPIIAMGHHTLDCFAQEDKQAN